MRAHLRLSVLGLAFIGALHGLAGDAAAQDAQEFAFQLRFRQELAAIRGTDDPRDDAAFAGVLLVTLKNETFALPLQVRIAEKAYAFGALHPLGYDAAMAAVTKLKELAPDRAAQWLELDAAIHLKALELGTEDGPDFGKVIDLHMLLAQRAMDKGDYPRALELYKIADDIARKNKAAVGDEIEDRVLDVRKAMRRQQRIDVLKKQLEKQPGDKGAAREMVDLYVFEADTPRPAVEYAGIVGDPVLLEHVTLAAKSFEELDEPQCLKLAQWYTSLGDDRTNPGRVAMLIRAKLYYELALRQHAERDDAFVTHKDALRDVERELSRFGIGMKRSRRLVRKLRGDEGRPTRDPRIDAAIEKGVAWLYEQQKRDTHWDTTQSHHAGGYTALVTYALLMAEEDPRTNDQLRQAIAYVLNMKMLATYSVCFRAHMWEVLPNNERSAGTVRQDVSKLSRFMRDGTIHYQLNSGATSDMSTTLGGFLVLWLGDISGIRSDNQAWLNGVQYLAEVQQADGGWRYNLDPNHKVTGSMTAAALTILLMAIDQEHLDDRHLELAQETLAKGMAWLDSNFNPKANPNGPWYTYYLAAVQHVGLLSGRKTFNGVDWYESAAEHLIETQQADGSWRSSTPLYTVQETAFAVVFLARGGVEFDSLNPTAPAPGPVNADAPAIDEAAPDDPNAPAKSKKPLPALDNAVPAG